MINVIQLEHQKSLEFLVETHHHSSLTILIYFWNEFEDLFES